jgi:hypothetical protein
VIGKQRREWALIAALLAALAGVSACSEDDPAGPPPPPPLEGERDSVEETIQYLSLVWRHKLYAEYEEVLHDEYEFFPLERDAEDFPWLEGSSWPKTVELGIAQNMFDPNFSGQLNPIDVIEITLTELSRRALPGNIVEVTCTQQGRVLTDTNDGWSFDTRIVLEIVPDPDQPGLFQIKKQTEIDAVLRSVDSSVESTSWGRVKGAYR